MTKHPVLLYAAVACLLATSCTPVPMPEVREEANGNQRFNKMLYGEYNFYAP